MLAPHERVLDRYNGYSEHSLQKALAWACVERDFKVWREFPLTAHSDTDLCNSKVDIVADKNSESDWWNGRRLLLVEVKQRQGPPHEWRSAVEQANRYRVSFGHFIWENESEIPQRCAALLGVETMLVTPTQPQSTAMSSALETGVLGVGVERFVRSLDTGSASDDPTDQAHLRASRVSSFLHFLHTYPETRDSCELLEYAGSVVTQTPNDEPIPELAQRFAETPF